MNAPKCFISYSWDNDNHKDWVRFLASELRARGIDARLDQWDTKLGINLPEYMETSVRESEYVLLICTPLFAEKANKGSGGVGYEKTIVTGEIFSGVSSKTKFIPVLRSGSESEAIPSYLRGKFYIDFRNDQNFNDSIDKLIRNIFDAPEHPPPPIGNRPKFNTQSAGVRSAQKEVHFDITRFSNAFEYAISYNGLRMGRDEARQLALRRLEE